MQGERSSQALQATALVHEAFLRLVDVASVELWKTRGHFFAAAAAAEAMRQILVENARYKERIALDTSTRFSRVTIIPNLSPPVTTTDQARTNRGHASGP